MIIITTVIIIIVIIIINNIINLGDHCHQYYHNYHQHDIMSIIIITIIIFLCTVNGKGEWSLHDLEVGEVQNLHKISNVGGCQLREKLARGGNWAMFRFKAMRTIARLGVKRASGAHAAASSSPSSWSAMISFQKLYTNTVSWEIDSVKVMMRIILWGMWNRADLTKALSFYSSHAHAMLDAWINCQLIHSKYFHRWFMIINRDHS